MAQKNSRNWLKYIVWGIAAIVCCAVAVRALRGTTPQQAAALMEELAAQAAPQETCILQQTAEDTYSPTAEMPQDVAIVPVQMYAEESTEASGTAAASQQNVPPDTGAAAGNAQPTAPPAAGASPVPEARLAEDGSYDSAADVANYIRCYKKLPRNYITKKEANALGWQGGSLEAYAPGKSIGGDRFGNREGLLPQKKGRSYTECDIDATGKRSRGAKRIVFSNDGLIYYTDDHYQTFTLLFGEE